MLIIRRTSLCEAEAAERETTSSPSSLGSDAVTKGNVERWWCGVSGIGAHQFWALALFHCASSRQNGPRPWDPMGWYLIWIATQKKYYKSRSVLESFLGDDKYSSSSSYSNLEEITDRWQLLKKKRIVNKGLMVLCAQWDSFTFRWELSPEADYLYADFEWVNM